MVQKMKKFSKEQKEKILEESYQEGCAVAELGKKYKLSPKTIHAWRRTKRKNQEKDNSPENPTNFIEVPIKEDVESRERISLKKAELVYEKFRIAIDGEISSAKIAPIMRILEGE